MAATDNLAEDITRPEAVTARRVDTAEATRPRAAITVHLAAATALLGVAAVVPAAAAAPTVVAAAIPAAATVTAKSGSVWRCTCP